MIGAKIESLRKKFEITKAKNKLKRIKRYVDSEEKMPRRKKKNVREEPGKGSKKWLPKKL